MIGISRFLGFVLDIYVYIIIASAIISFVNPDPYNRVVVFLRRLTEPVYYYVRKYLPFVRVGSIDFSPLVVILAIQFVKYTLLRHF